MDPAYLIGAAAMITALTGVYMARRERRKTSEKLDTGNGHTVGQLAVTMVKSLEDHRGEFRRANEAQAAALTAHAQEDARRFDELANILRQGGLL